MGLVLGIAPAGGQHLLGGADPVGPLGLGQVLLGLADPPFLLHFLLGDLCLAAGLAHPLALGQGHLDGRQQGTLGHRLDQIARDPGLAGPADEGLVVKGGEQHHAAGQILLQMVSAAVSPSKTGIFISISTTSGRLARQSSTASNPSPAWPTTWKSSSVSISARSIRVMGSSSAMITVLIL